jgi:hypothetical protein
MWIDKRRRVAITIKVNMYEKYLIESLKEIFGCDASEAVRRAIWSVRILFDPDLKLRDIVKELDWDKPLSDLIKPFPELEHIVDLEYTLWKSYFQPRENE